MFQVFCWRILANWTVLVWKFLYLTHFLCYPTGTSEDDRSHHQPMSFFFFKHWNEVGWTRLGTCSSVSGRETWSDDVLFWCFSEYFGLKHSMKQAHGQDQTRNLPKLHRISMISLLISAWFQLCKRLVIHKTKHKFLNKSLLKTTRQVSARFNCSWWDQSTWIPPLGHYEATPARRAMVSAGKGLSWCDVRSNSCWLSNRHRWVTSGLSMTGGGPWLLLGPLNMVIQDDS